MRYTAAHHAVHNVACVDKRLTKVPCRPLVVMSLECLALCVRVFRFLPRCAGNDLCVAAFAATAARNGGESTQLRCTSKRHPSFKWPCVQLQQGPGLQP